MRVPSPRTARRPRSPLVRLCLEALEGRAVPATVNWTLGANGDFADATAWTVAGTYLKISTDAAYLAYFDFNADGRIDVTDLGQFASRYLTTLP